MQQHQLIVPPVDGAKQPGHGELGQLLPRVEEIGPPGGNPVLVSLHGNDSKATLALITDPPPIELGNKYGVSYVMAD